LTTPLARLVGAAVATVALVGAAAWGCAAQSNAPVREHDWQHQEPDGGWQGYRPSPRAYDVDPLRAALGPTVPYMPTTSPVNPSSTTLH
jgi:hypothetical protein